MGYPYIFENPIAGKTGTTKPKRWLVHGMVPNLVTGYGLAEKTVRFTLKKLDLGKSYDGTPDRGPS